MAVALQVLLAAVVTTNIVPIFATIFELPNRGGVVDDVPEAIRTTIVPTSSIVIGIKERWIQQSLLMVATIALWLILSLLAVAWLAERGGRLSDADFALYRANAPWMSVLLRTSTAFLAGWWAARGGVAGTIKYGLLIGALIAVSSWTFTLVLARPLDLSSVLFASPVVVGAIAGVAFARSHSRAREL